MNSAPPTSAPRRRVWRWVLLGAGLCLAPLVVLALVAASYLTLDRDVAVLRRHVMHATDASWSTKVQVSVGRLTLGAVREGLRFVHHAGIDDARLALRAVRSASVGVYTRSSGSDDWSRETLFHDADQAMQKRGWTRLVGVADHNQTVLIYVPRDLDADGPIDLCLAVVDGKDLVVVATTVDAAGLDDLIAKHAGGDLKERLRLSKLKL